MHDEAPITARDALPRAHYTADVTNVLFTYIMPLISNKEGKRGLWNSELGHHQTSLNTLMRCLQLRKCLRRWKIDMLRWPERLAFRSF